MPGLERLSAGGLALFALLLVVVCFGVVREQFCSRAESRLCSRQRTILFSGREPSLLSAPPVAFALLVPGCPRLVASSWAREFKIPTNCLHIMLSHCWLSEREGLREKPNAIRAVSAMCVTAMTASSAADFRPASCVRIHGLLIAIGGTLPTQANHYQRAHWQPCSRPLQRKCTV